MNDPMEGYFQYSKDILTDSNIKDLYNKKTYMGLVIFQRDMKIF